MFKKPTFWLIAILLGATLDSFYWGYARYRLERSHRTVEVAVDMAQLAQVAAARGVTLDSLLARCKGAGVTSVALSELTLADLEATGRVQIYPRDQALQLYGRELKGIQNHDFVVTSRDPSLIGEISRTLARKCATAPELLYPEAAAGGTSAPLLAVSGGRDVRELMGACFDPQHVKLAQRNGFAVICRYLNYAGLTEEAIRFMAALADRKGAHLVIFAEEEVLGYEDLIPACAEAFAEAGVAFGTVEFAKQRGDAKLAEAIYPQVVRVHSIAENEQLKLTPEVAARRFVRAAKERNIRLCYLRFFPQPKAGALDDNVAYLQSVTAGLRAAGLKLGPARAVPPFSVPAEHRAIAAVGVAAGFVLLLCTVVGLRLGHALALWALAGGLAAAAVLAAPALGAKLAAFGAALVFPSLAMVLPQVARWTTDRVREPGPIAASLLTLLPACGVTLVGVALGVCLLGDARFMLKLDQFAGIKLAHLVPLAVALFCYVGRLVPTRGLDWFARWTAARAKFRELGSQPFLFWQAGAAVFVLGLAAVALMRTGNEPGFGVSGLELQLRDWMETVLVARPRFKEFALGHPALVLAVGCALRGWRGAVVPLLIVAAVGQVSLFNTFCHIHTPIHLSVLRTVNGIWLGWVIGVLALQALQLLTRARRSLAQPAESEAAAT